MTSASGRTTLVSAGLLVLLMPAAFSQSVTIGRLTRSAYQAQVQQNVGVQADTLIRFSFDIPDMVTNHQFAGQKNSFHVSYEYTGVLKGGGFDPAGHRVSTETFPYFQAVREQIIDYVAKYPDTADFYELFGVDICRDILASFPQIKQIELTIDVPAFAEVKVDRRVTIVLSRRANRVAAHNKMH